MIKTNYGEDLSPSLLAVGPTDTRAAIREKRNVCAMYISRAVCDGVAPLPELIEAFKIFEAELVKRAGLS